jgi:hypothetical protein
LTPRNHLKIAMSSREALIGYTPDLQASGVWFGPLNSVARRGWIGCELSLVWQFLPDPRAKPFWLFPNGPVTTSLSSSGPDVLDDLQRDTSSR